MFVNENNKQKIIKLKQGRNPTTDENDREEQEKSKLTNGKLFSANHQLSLSL